MKEARLEIIFHSPWSKSKITHTCNSKHRILSSSDFCSSMLLDMDSYTPLDFITINTEFNNCHVDVFLINLISNLNGNFSIPISNFNSSIDSDPSINSSFNSNSSFNTLNNQNHNENEENTSNFNNSHSIFTFEYWFYHLRMDMRHSSKFIFPRWIGHRGFGMNGPSDLHILSIAENTLESFEMAQLKGGAKWIEFDVQITRDLHPIIYHDWKVKGKDNPFLEGIEIQSLSLKQFKELRNWIWCDHSSNDHPNKKNQDQIKRAQDDNLYDSPLGSLYYSHLDYIMTPTLTLKDALNRVDPLLGFNIEIKYPMKEEIIENDLAQALLSPLQVIDLILNVLHLHGGNRSIFISSFHPDICSILAWKQQKYPIAFLTEGIEEETTRMGINANHANHVEMENNAKNMGMENNAKNAKRDWRCSSIERAIKWCDSIPMISTIIIDAQRILEMENDKKGNALKWIREIKNKSRLLIGTYGKINIDEEWVIKQYKWGINTIITDNLIMLKNFNLL